MIAAGSDAKAPLKFGCRTGKLFKLSCKENLAKRYECGPDLP